jgi:hypothetical protein
MRTFKFIRTEDVSGVSGTGEVAEGICFASGKVAISFYPVEPTFVANVIVFNSMDDVEKIHGHDGSTTIQWDDEKPKRRKNGKNT